jgi:medium-chain acyl-[acyl-carrier-protein] hydrolase
MRQDATSSWFFHYASVRQPRLRLFCFPYAGGSARIFRSWPPFLDSSIELCVCQFPGREHRFSETAISDFPLLLTSLVSALRLSLDLPYACFGHSLGALVMFELTHQLRLQECRLPIALFPSGCRAPHLPNPHSPIHALPDEAFFAELVRLKGTPHEVLEHTELMHLMLPMLRADFTLAETYVYREQLPLTCPISVFGGRDDHEVQQSSLYAWMKQTTGSFRARFYEGDHFFLHEAIPTIVQAINEDLSIS